MPEPVRRYSDADVAARLDWATLIDALALAFKRGGESPPRPHYDIGVAGEAKATLLLMPAWTEGHHIGLKTVTVFPGNAARGAPSIAAQYLLFSAKNGALIALLEAGELTARRTAAASALASLYLSRKDAQRLLVVGTGRLSSNLAMAHATIRNFEDVAVWGRDPKKARAVADQLFAQGLPARAAGDLEKEARTADLISCCTLSCKPLIKGSWLKPGTHLDLVGAFTPLMAETDDDALQRGTLFVDTRAGACQEAGEIVQAIRRGAIKPDDIQASLFDLVSKAHHGRTSTTQITVFKSVGCALEDLAAAELCVSDNCRSVADATSIA
ncbi:delta(1)-pyrroline-2-carboxylate reductase [Brucella sp. NBRC 12952]|uniref:Ornithine cyclodeaminase family protein n=1 Tax=Brucella pseudogrignonensis TaxID=419475 RepID=A0A7Y3T954_9HYPH|nr:ornithine cyclodeaminase family protein [Brucella pseudogrignonensis]NNV23394.1 ornithine cyclodeaminase family protein [Brucella pseudogrignonensis]